MTAEPAKPDGIDELLKIAQIEAIWISSGNYWVLGIERSPTAILKLSEVYPHQSSRTWRGKIHKALKMRVAMVQLRDAMGQRP